MDIPASMLQTDDVMILTKTLCMINNGRCAYWKMAETHAEPDSFAANTNGLWACNDGRVNFDLNGPYTGTVPYNVEKNQRVMIRYNYQMENGQVTGLQVEVV